VQALQGIGRWHDQRFAVTGSMTFNTDLESLGHSHDFRHARHDDHARRTRLVVVLSAVMMFVEIGAGLWLGSMALLADGAHMATHVGALVIALIAYRYAHRHAQSRQYSFGTGKVGELAGFGSAIALAMVALGIGWESAERLIMPEPVAFSEAILVAIIGLGVNLASAWLLSGGHEGHSHSHSHSHGHGNGHHHDHASHHDNNLRSALMHVLADAMTSVLAIAALLGGHFFGWLWLDAAMGLVGAAVIALWAARLMQETGRILLDAQQSVIADAVKREVEQIQDVAVLDLHAWQVGPGAHSVILSYRGHADADAVRSKIKAITGVVHITVEQRPATASG
jgi:cation diffusion facilitator family transporter